jgi:hypothetical protein
VGAATSAARALRVERRTLDHLRNIRYSGTALDSNERSSGGRVALGRDSSRGIVVAALIVAANFAVVLQITGISYGRFQWVEFASAYNTPTATPTRTPRPLGDGCSSGPECGSTFCVTGVCCDSACDQPGELCDVAGLQGTCTVPTAPAPALSSGALAAAVALLIAIAALTLRATRRRHRNAG